MLTTKDLNKEVLQSEFDFGMTAKQIGEKYNISHWSIYSYAKKWDVDISSGKPKKEIATKVKCECCGKEFSNLYKDSLCYNCWKFKDTKDKEVVNTSSRSRYYNDIVRLRGEGKSYAQIAEELGCSKSTVGYCLSETTRKRAKDRADKWKEENPWLKKLSNQVSNFRLRKPSTDDRQMCKDWRHKLRSAVSEFKGRTNMETNINYSYKDVIDYFGGTTVTCELTGRTIDLTTDDYNIDHIIPVSRGGTNSLENMAFTIPSANAAKSNMLNEEFVALCKEVCEHFGYTVTKN